MQGAKVKINQSCCVACPLDRPLRLGMFRGQSQRGRTERKHHAHGIGNLFTRVLKVFNNVCTFDSCRMLCPAAAVAYGASRCQVQLLLLI
jgi:hypothetical protein